jgi:ActR/RegA family two-component response regulator
MTERNYRAMTQNLLQPNATQSTTKARKALRLVLGLGETPYAKAAEAHFTALGWDVTVAKTAKDARKLALKQRAAAAVLAADLGPESGWLSSVKLTRSRPGTRVVLVGKVRTGEMERFATFAGAVGFVAETEGVCRLVKVLAGPEAVCPN